METNIFRKKGNQYKQESTKKENIYDTYPNGRTKEKKKKKSIKRQEHIFKILQTYTNT